MKALTRFVLAGFAAFFVALRYASVLALLAQYVFFLGSAAVLTAAEGPGGLLVLLVFVPYLALHSLIRWEGPETAGEQAARQGRGFFYQR
jgi:hypothetical protein